MAITQQKLLLVAVSLAAARFILMPLLEWQADKREQLQVVTQQLERAIRLKNSGPEQEQQLQNLQQIKADVLGLYPDASQTTQFKLSIQQQLEQQLTEQELEVNLFDWLSQQTEQNGSVERHQIRLVVQGPPHIIMTAFMNTLISKPWLRVLDIQLQLRNATRRNPGTTAATITLDITALNLTAGANND